MTRTAPAAPERSDQPGTALRRGRLGILGIVFFVVAASAPLVGITGALPVAMLAGNGAAAPGAYLLVGLVLLLFTVGYAALSSRMTNSGAFSSLVATGLSPVAGVGAAFASLVGYLTIQLAIFGFFGAIVSGQLAGFGVDTPWWLWTLVAWAAVTALALLRVDVGAKLLGVLLSLELLSLLIAAIAMLANGGPEGPDLVASFAPDRILTGGFAGGAGIALAFAFASFIGFEATAIYGEESTDPKRTVPRATYLAIGVISVLFALVAFAMVTGMGASTIADEVVARSSVDGAVLANPAGVLFSLAEQYVGPWLAQVMGWLVISSLFAGLLAFQNAASRYFFALGRSGVLPAALGRVSASGAPRPGVLVTSAITLVVILVFAIAGLDPVGALFFWMSAVTVIAIVAVEILVSVAVIAYFRREGGRRAGGGGVWSTLIAPGLSALLLLVGLYLLMSRFNLLAGTVPEGVDPSLPESAWQLNPLGWVLVLVPFAALGIGLLVGALTRRRSGELARDFAPDAGTLAADPGAADPGAADPRTPDPIAPTGGS